MQAIDFIVTVFFILALALPIHILSKNPKKITSIIFALFSLTIAVWYFGYIFFLSAPDENSCRSWFRFMASGWALLGSFFLHFILELTGNKIFSKHKWLYILIYLPVLPLTYYTVIDMRLINQFIHTNSGWVYSRVTNNFWSAYNNIYMLVYMLASIILLYIWTRKSPIRAHKKQGRFIIFAILISFLIFSLTIYLPPFFNFENYSYLDIAPIMIWEIGLSIAIIKYGLMLISPESAASSILNTMADGLLIINPEGSIVSANPALFDLLEKDEKSILNKPVKQLLPGAFSSQNLLKRLESEQMIRDMEINYSLPGGRNIYLSISASIVIDKYGQNTGYVALLRNISERKETEKQLQYMATHDVLTNLPNRLVLNDRLRSALSRAKRYKQLVEILLIDIDRFKDINDTYGHDTGDILLKEIAKKLSENIRNCDTVTRLGGDEFVIVLTDVKNKSDCDVVIERIRSSFAAPIIIKKNPFIITLSIGISIYPHHADNIEELYKYADLALYKVKESGRNNYRLYSPEIDSSARKSQKFEQELRVAIMSNEFLLYYQPIYDVKLKKIRAMEALLRWDHPEHGIINPIEFLPIAERSGLIIPMGEWVLKKVCGQQKLWREKGLEEMPIAVNLSAKQFQDPELIKKIDGALAEYDIDPSLLELEFTESTAMSEIELTIKTIGYLKDKGISIIIDNFGSGYSSMAWLKLLNVMAIKIDRLFIQNIAHDIHDAAIVKAIVSMAHTMGIQVMAEGIETKEQLDSLKFMHWDETTELSCDWVQGYFFSRPVTPEKAAELLLKDESRVSLKS